MNQENNQNGKTLFNYCVKVARQEGGFTFAMNMQPTPKHGFFVSLKETQNCCDEAGFLFAYEYATTHGVPYFGGWYDSESGKTYFDATIHVATREEAEKIGRANGQIAIFDIEKSESIYL